MERYTGVPVKPAIWRTHNGLSEKAFCLCQRGAVLCLLRTESRTGSNQPKNIGELKGFVGGVARVEWGGRASPLWN